MIPAPEYLFLTINEICNLRCQHCDYWRAEEPQVDVISLERQDEIIQEFAELSPQGKLVICGGEPMLDVNTYFHVCKVARSLCLRVLSVVNGSLINSTKAAERVFNEGPHEISISLDGHDAKTHDRMRGKKGSWKQATRALSLLLLCKGEEKQNLYLPRIYAIGLLSRSTYEHLDEWYDLVLHQIGADKLKLNALQPTFMHQRLGQRRETDEFFAQESQVDPGKLESMLKLCDAKYDLHYNPVWMRQVVAYFAGLHGKPDLSRGWNGNFQTEDHICNSPWRNLMVDMTGRVSFCFSQEFESAQLVGHGDLRRFWASAQQQRLRMDTCNALCGISHSVRREHASLYR
jgi:MoaA/NifB/PqqE/SkfB family radical SAM enzyme